MPSSAERASVGTPSNSRSQAMPSSTQRQSTGARPDSANRSEATEISPRASLSAAIKVAMNTVHSPILPKLALIAGPTASGKSALAVRLAEMTDGVVINADASQLYNDLSALSARPSETDMARAPHRLFGTVDGGPAYLAAVIGRDACVGRVCRARSRPGGG